MRPDKQVQWDKAIEADGRVDHCTIGSSDETVHMCVSVPFGSIDESISVESAIVSIQIR
jgi:hypothetical protein